MNPADLPLFPLASWELPPDSTEPLIAPATMRWRGKLLGRETDWLVRVAVEDHLGRVLVCAEDCLHEAKWTTSALLPLRGVDTQNDWVVAINNHLSVWGKFLKRTVYLMDEQGEWTLYVEASGATQLRNEEGMPKVEMTWPFDIVHATSEQLYAEFLRQWHDPNTDLNFARCWLLLSEDEKYCLLISWKRGGKAEFLHGMRLVLNAFSPQLAEGSSQWAFYPTSGGFGYVEVVSGELLDEVETPAQLQVWGDALLEVFGPRWNEELSREHSCARDQHSHGGSHYLVFTQERTSHEQLEAARELSAWLDERETGQELPAEMVARLRATLR